MEKAPKPLTSLSQSPSGVYFFHFFFLITKLQTSNLFVSSYFIHSLGLGVLSSYIKKQIKGPFLTANEVAPGPLNFFPLTSHSNPLFRTSAHKRRSHTNPGSDPNSTETKEKKKTSSRSSVFSSSAWIPSPLSPETHRIFAGDRHLRPRAILPASSLVKVSATPDQFSMRLQGSGF